MRWVCGICAPACRGPTITGRPATPGTGIGPPKRLRDYADFIGELIAEFGDSFATLELWNERVYRYSLIDLDPRREAIEGFHVDENEYHMGVATYAGGEKPAWDVLAALLKRDQVTG